MIKILKNSFLFALCFSLLSMYSYAAPTYKLIDLGLQESDRSEAVAVNDKGQVAGSYWMFGKKYYFLWEEKSGITLIDLPETSVIAVLNNAGQIAGNYTDTSGKDRGFIWDQCSGFFDIGTLGGSFTRVYDMNDLGQIVGESESSNLSLVDMRKECHAFLWQCGSMINLGGLPGDLGMQGDRSIATGINNCGQIVGISNYLIAHKGKFQRANDRSFIWFNGIIEGVDMNIGPQFGATAPSISNCGKAMFNNNKMGYFIVDLSTKNMIETPFAKNLGRDAEFTDKGDIVLMHNKRTIDIVFTKMSVKTDHSWDAKYYEYIYLPQSYDNPQIWTPNSFRGVDFNNQCWVVGTATNIYGEHHGVLLIPIKE